MYVNPVWYGVLMTIVVEIMLAILLSLIGRIRNNDEEDSDMLTPDEYKALLEELSGKKFRVIEKDGFLVGEVIEDDKDEPENH